MNYVCVTAIILVILLLIYLIRQPKTLFEGMDYIPLSTSSLKHKTVQSADVADGKNPNFDVGQESWYNIDNPDVLYSSCEDAASGENIDVGMCSFNPSNSTEGDSENGNNNSGGSNSGGSNSGGSNSGGSNSGGSNSGGSNSGTSASNDNMHDDSNNNYQKINQNYTFNITIPNNKPKDYLPPPEPVNQLDETYNDLIRPTMCTEAFSLPFNKY